MARPKIRSQIQEAGKELKSLMQGQLQGISESLIDQIMALSKRLTPSERLDAIKGLQPIGIQTYRALLLDGMAVLSLEALAQARKEIPKAKHIEMAETIDQLPPKLREKLKARNNLLIGKQISDLQSVISFAYAESEDSTDSETQIRADLEDSAVGWLEGTALEAGSSLTAATVINEAREAFFFDDEVLEEVDAFQFVNGDPVTEICQELAGTIFSKEDPDAFRYTPPLHWNCKSFIIPILSGKLGNREITSLRSQAKGKDDQIQFQDHPTLQIWKDHFSLIHF